MTLSLTWYLDRTIGPLHDWLKNNPWLFPRRSLWSLAESSLLGHDSSKNIPWRNKGNRAGCRVGISVLFFKSLFTLQTFLCIRMTWEGSTPQRSWSNNGRVGPQGLRGLSAKYKPYNMKKRGIWAGHFFLGGSSVYLTSLLGDSDVRPLQALCKMIHLVPEMKDQWSPAIRRLKSRAGRHIIKILSDQGSNWSSGDSERRKGPCPEEGSLEGHYQKEKKEGYARRGDGLCKAIIMRRREMYPVRDDGERRGIWRWASRGESQKVTWTSLHYVISNFILQATGVAGRF